ncbi:DUF1244 domain-containing protein [Stappia sp. GBMRC 2046]|uniref:DUF1244 domain-containing protein n=2 Tax=Stappia sediminis TaxID=2692190 RepID=A0A7X3LUF4_9HYPH|nr:DUF1244 domain-containing protein [Stappia sediminis]MXN65317.1 DUF1244 domain-containing protein [Stappia sediminis]
MTDIDEKTRMELEAAAFRRLVSHLRERTDVQNIDMMNLAGFCRNCLSNWYRDAAGEKGLDLDKEEAREIVYGMPYSQWKAKYQNEASEEQKAAFEINKPQH